MIERTIHKVKYIKNHNFLQSSEQFKDIIFFEKIKHNKRTVLFIIEGEEWENML